MYKLYDFFVNDVAKYSITRQCEAKQVCNYVNGGDSSSDSVIDLTCGVGGDAVNFAHKFKHVYAFEIDKNTFDLLNKNIEKFGITNISTFNEDCLNVFNKGLLNSGVVVYLDPPWGKLYKSQTSLDLYLSGKPIHEILKRIQNIPIYMKCPFNTNTSMFKEGIVDRIIIYNKSKKSSFQIIKMLFNTT
jgi:predicted RNA methylase